MSGQQNSRYSYIRNSEWHVWFWHMCILSLTENTVIYSVDFVGISLSQVWIFLSAGQKGICERVRKYGKQKKYTECSCVSAFWPRARRVLINFFRRDRKIVKSDYLARYICPSVYPHRTTRLPMNVFYEIRYFSVFRKYFEKFIFWLQSYRNNCTLLEDLCTLMAITGWIILGFKNGSDTNCR